MQPYFFPYIGYWQLIHAVDKFVVYDDVNFIKGGWINRNYILLNQEKHLVTLPLSGISSFTKINEINVIDNIKLKTKLLKTIDNAYKKAPYFDCVFPMIEKIILENGAISTLIYDSILSLKKYFNLNTEIYLSSDLKIALNEKSVDRVIHIVKSLDGNEYINAIGGQELYSKDKFKAENIALSFLKTNLVKYEQYTADFVPNLSIIDVMMFNSPEQIRAMLDNYELI